MKLIYLKSSNFLSFSDLEYYFGDTPVLLQGENLSESESQESNGSGKSSILAMIAYCLIQQPLRKTDVRDCELVKWGEKIATLELHIYCDLRKETLIIQRSIPTKGSSKLSLEIKKGDDITKVQYATVNDGNKFILQWLDLTSDDIKNYYLINRLNYKSFFSSSNTDKLKLITRLSESTKVDEIIEDINLQNQDQKQNTLSLEKEQAKIIGSIDFIKDKIKEEKEKDYLTIKQSKLDNLSTYINNQLNLIIEAKESEESYKQELSDLEHKKDKINLSIKECEWKKGLINCDYSSEYSAINGELSECNDIIKLIESGVLKNRQEIKSLTINKNALEVELAGLIECPSCKHSWLPTSQDPKDVKKSIEKIKTSIQALESLIQEYEDEKVLIEEGIIEINNKISSIKAKEQESINAVSEIDLKIRTKRNEIRSLDIEIKSANDLLNKTIDNINTSHSNIEKAELERDKIELENDNTEIDLLQSKLDSYQHQYDDITDKMSESQSLEQSNSMWVQRMKSFKMNLATTQLEIIQNYMNKILGDMKSDMRVMLEGFKTLASGEIKEEITAYVVRDEIRKISLFSEGEYGRLELALILAVQSMLNHNNKYGGLSFLHIDEVLEGVDGLGLQNIMKSLSTIKQAMFVTTHVTNRNLYPHILTVQKVNKSSKIK